MCEIIHAREKATTQCYSWGFVFLLQNKTTIHHKDKCTVFSFAWSASSFSIMCDFSNIPWWTAYTQIDISKKTFHEAFRSFHFMLICLHKDFLSQSYMWLTLFLFFFGFGPGCYIHIIIRDGCFFKLHCEYKETGSLLYVVQLYQQWQLNVIFINKVYIDKITVYVIKELHTLWKLKYCLLLCTPSASSVV